MAEAEGPSPAAEAWLAPFRRACDRIAAEVRALPPARRAEALGRGAGGDVTLLVDRVAEDAMVAELEAFGRPLTLISEELGRLESAGAAHGWTARRSRPIPPSTSGSSS
jgi:myo-inositol-1(or 4)-monophosphatase